MKATRTVSHEDATAPPTQVTPPPQEKSGAENPPRPLPLLEGMNPGLSLEQTPIVRIENLEGLLETVREAKRAAKDKISVDPPPPAAAGEPTQARPLHGGPLLPVKTPAVPISSISSHLHASRFKDTGKVQSLSGQVEEDPTTVRNREGAPAPPDDAGARAKGYSDGARRRWISGE